ncbi:MAG: PAS domain-containing sensor histidine kinase [Syntrophobacteraceae bacterium]
MNSKSAQTAESGNAFPGGKGEGPLDLAFVRSIIDHFPMPFFIVDRNLTITYMNDQFEQLAGYSKSEAVNRMSCAEVLQTSLCHTDECLLRQAMDKRIPVAGFRHTIHDREGTEIPVTAHCSLITDSENRVIGGFKALRNITPLYEAEQKIRMLVEVTREGILMVDENSRVIYANSRMAQILNRDGIDLVGTQIHGLLPPQLLGIISDMGRKVESEHYREMCFCSTIQPAGEFNLEDRYFETCIVVSKLGKGLITCMYFRDLTERIQVERELFRANSFLNNIITSSADGIIVADLEGRVLLYNDSARRILGYGAEDVAGKPGFLAGILGPQTAAETARRLRGDEYGPQATPGYPPLTLITKEGEEVPVSFTCAAIRKNGSQIGTVSTFSDLREHFRMRRELEETRMQLLQAEKIASLGRLAAGVAHEINNPLSGILIFADILLKELAGRNRQWSEDLQEIIDQTMRCKEIVARLLDFSRQSIGRRQEYHINTAVERSMELVGHQALFYNVEFVKGLQTDIPVMTGDPGQLQQVFINFLLNAATAMGGRGKIAITSRYDPACEEVTLEFADSGPGIAPEIMSRLFDPFFTTRGPGEGTGLGLSVAYGIIQQHGGNISAANSPSGGAVFTVRLPLKSPEKTIEFSC